jgi:4-diphosphocytidyl-2-C-methyl-D-erythritol kinase
MLIKSYAKINLSLKIGKKLPSGYHEIKSVMQQINLYDILEFKKIKEDKTIIKSNKKELENENNLAYKAALILKNKFKIKEGIGINIEKNIPLASGLAGGSGNAAATLKAMNKLFNLNLDDDKLIEIGRELGSDVPFQITGKTALVEGTGEKITKINPPKENDILIIKPDIDISTKWAYEEFDKTIQKKDAENDFEPLITKKHPIIKEIKEQLKSNGAEKALMSGSGPAVFGLFKDKTTAEKAYNNLKNKYPFVYLTTIIK